MIITGAVYSNPQNNHMTVFTSDAGSILVSKIDDQTLWDSVLSQVTPDPYVAPEPVSAPFPTKVTLQDRVTGDLYNIYLENGKPFREEVT